MSRKHDKTHIRTDFIQNRIKDCASRNSIGIIIAVNKYFFFLFNRPMDPIDSLRHVSKHKWAF